MRAEQPAQHRRNVADGGVDDAVQTLARHLLAAAAQRARVPYTLGLVAGMTIAATGRFVAGHYINGDYDSVYFVYNEFKSVVSQKLTLSRVLPAELPEQTTPVPAPV